MGSAVNTWHHRYQTGRDLTGGGSGLKSQGHTCTIVHLKSSEIGSLQRGSKSMNYKTHMNLAGRAQRT